MSLVSGDPKSEVWIVGEAPGADEVKQGKPFVGASGMELTRMLESAGWNREEMFITNVCHTRPPNNDISAMFFNKTEGKRRKIAPLEGRYPTEPIVKGMAALRAQIHEYQPKMVLAVGGTALWALTGLEGISSYRGSFLHYIHHKGVRVVPIYHPAAILRQWSMRPVTVHDLTKAKRWHDGDIKAPPLDSINFQPTYGEVMKFLGRIQKEGRDKVPSLESLVAADIETLPNVDTPYIQSIALAFQDEVLCIPFVDQDGGHYWDLGKEHAITLTLRYIMQHPEIRMVWQNGTFDLRVIWEHWGWMPGLYHDTMLMQHALYPSMPKNLSYLSSLYLDWHVHWKDVSYKPGPDLWYYNAKDTLTTLRLVPPMLDALVEADSMETYRHSISLVEPVLCMEISGVRIDPNARDRLKRDLSTKEKESLTYIHESLGFPLNPKSNPLMKALFYHDLKVRQRVSRKTKKPTLDDAALRSIAKEKAALRPLIEAILTYRSAGTLRANAIDPEPDERGRQHTSYNIGGTETGRFSSSSDVFGRGLNLQNQHISIRPIYLPEEGQLMMACDLDRADAQVVAWEAGDDELKQMFREGVDIHTENAKVLGVSRDLAKRGAHATNYGCSARTLGSSLGITTHEAQKFIDRWMDAHPAIRRWHERVTEQIETKHYLRTPFGRRRYYFDRMSDQLINQALAYVPQSAVADVICIGMRRVYTDLPEVRVLLQVHDEVVLSIPDETWVEKVKQKLLVEIPYEDPLIIPVGGIVGKNWGELK